MINAHRAAKVSMSKRLPSVCVRRVHPYIARTPYTHILMNFIGLISVKIADGTYTALARIVANAAATVGKVDMGFLKRLAKHRDPFMGGMFMYMGVMSLMQDCMGKEAYLASANENWVSGVYSVPGALVLVVLAAWISRPEGTK